MPEDAEALDVPAAWASLSRHLAATQWRRLVVLGATDVGKSSFCRYLGHQLAREIETVDLLDTDLGQKMVGPPGCVTLTRCSRDVGFQLSRIRFVGEVNPAINMAGVIAACARLASQSAADRLIVNTSGLIAGAGISLKRWKLDALHPDHVVGIARGGELAPILATLPRQSAHQLRPSQKARRKSAALRARNRQDALARAMGSYCNLVLPGLLVEDLHRTPIRPDRLRLCGLGDERGEDQAVGLIRWSDYAARNALWTSRGLTNVHRLRLGMDLTDFGGILSGEPGAVDGQDGCRGSGVKAFQQDEGTGHHHA